MISDPVHSRDIWSLVQGLYEWKEEERIEIQKWRNAFVYMVRFSSSSLYTSVNTIMMGLEDFGEAYEKRSLIHYR